MRFEQLERLKTIIECLTGNSEDDLDCNEEVLSAEFENTTFRLLLNEIKQNLFQLDETKTRAYIHEVLSIITYGVKYILEENKQTLEAYDRGKFDFEKMTKEQEVLFRLYCLREDLINNIYLICLQFDVDFYYLQESLKLDSRTLRIEKQDIGYQEIGLLNTTNKLKWLGTPAQFGFIIQELIGKGYIEKPSNSLRKDTELLLQHFDIVAKKATIEKEISERQNSLSPSNRARFKIPFKDSLK